MMMMMMMMMMTVLIVRYYVLVLVAAVDVRLELVDESAHGVRVSGKAGQLEGRGAADGQSAVDRQRQPLDEHRQSVVGAAQSGDVPRRQGPRAADTQQLRREHVVVQQTADVDQLIDGELVAEYCAPTVTVRAG